MDHLKQFRQRNVLSLPLVEGKGWRLKQYAVLADGRTFGQEIADAASAAAVKRLPKAGELADQNGNHGVGFQIVHFAEVAVVSPVFYWQWGSVLANIDQMRAPWTHPMEFDTGVEEVVGCVWEMQIVGFEVSAWTDSLLNEVGTPHAKLTDYLERRLPASSALVSA